jgi:hypothetical protein
MSEILSQFKQNKISVLINQYNFSIAKLNHNLLINVRNINNLRIRNKNYVIQLFINNYNNNVKNLKNKLNSYIQNINSYSGNFPHTFNNKKALLIGINYLGTEYELNGCIQDVDQIKFYLETKGFNNFEIMTDLTDIKPTRINILNSIKNFINSASNDDLLFIHYSGHGSYTYDNNGDEIDGKDEILVSSNLEYITDDELKNIFKEFSKPNITIVGLFDCCHSGTIFDIKFTYDYLNNKYIENQNDGDCPGNILMISGCMDNQTSEEAILDNKPQGALTWSFIDCINKTPNCSWRELLKSMRHLLKIQSFPQIPQLSTDSFYDIDTKVFI